MQILLVSATELEIAPFLLHETTIEHLVTGVGVPATVYQLSKLLSLKQYDLVVQAGIAGSFTAEIPLGETVIVSRDAFADAGALEEGQLKTLFDMGLAEANSLPYTGGWLVNNSGYVSESVLPKVNAVTVNTVSDEQNTTELYRSTFNAQIESMEGAAFHYVCLQERVTFIQFRSISNFVGERDKSRWKMKLAIDNLNLHLLHFMQDIPRG
jgi:futalosine hydrolase